MSSRPSRDPARAGLHLHHWPPACRAAWESAKARRPGLFRAMHGADRYALPTILKAEKGLRRLFGHASREGMLEQTQVPLDLLDPEFLDSFYNHLIDCGNADWSIVGRFAELELAYGLMYPSKDFRWLMKPDGVAITESLELHVKPRFVPSSAVLQEWGEELYLSGLEKQDRQIRWALVRDGLMVALLTLLAPRLRALSSLQLGRHMTRVGTQWHLDQHASITKVRRDHILPCGADISQMIDRYVNVERTEMLRGGTSDAFWISWYGRPLKATSISGLMWRRTLERFGVGFGPHRFRTCLTTTAATESTVCARDASVVQNHTAAISLKNYNRAKALSATRRNDERLRVLRAETKQLAMRAYAGKERRLG